MGGQGSRKTLYYKVFRDRVEEALRTGRPVVVQDLLSIQVSSPEGIRGPETQASTIIQAPSAATDPKSIERVARSGSPRFDARCQRRVATTRRVRPKTVTKEAITPALESPIAAATSKSCCLRRMKPACRRAKSVAAETKAVQVAKRRDATEEPGRGSWVDNVFIPARRDGKRSRIAARRKRSPGLPSHWHEEGSRSSSAIIARTAAGDSALEGSKGAF